jgi:hypothetical protein
VFDGIMMGKQNYLERNLLKCHLVAGKCNITTLDVNLDLHSEKLALIAFAVAPVHQIILFILVTQSI